MQCPLASGQRCLETRKPLVAEERQGEDERGTRDAARGSLRAEQCTNRGKGRRCTLDGSDTHMLPDARSMSS